MKLLSMEKKMEEVNLRYPASGQNYRNTSRPQISSPKTEVKQCGKSLREYLREFCEMSTIQGLSNLVKDITLFERIWWIVVFILGVTGSCYLVYQILDKWVTTPVLVSLATKEMSINQIPFPAVTICPEAKISRYCLNYTHILQARKRGDIILTKPKENVYFDNMALLCRKENHNGTFELLEQALEQLEDYADDEPVTTPKPKENKLRGYAKFLSKCAAVDLDMASCTWMGKEVTCKDVLYPILTDEGLCYSFNMYDVRDIYSDINTMPYFHERSRQSDWTPDKGYKKKTNNVNKMYPRRAFLSGAKNAFVAVFLTHKKDINYACQDFSIQGVRVSLHTATKIPRPSQVFFSVGLNRITNAAVTPSLAETSKKTRHYSPEKRNCYFGKERSLKYFKYYSQSNCNLECWTNYTISHCGCVSFYMPRDNETDVCDLEQRYCMEDARLNYTQDILSEHLKSVSKKHRKGKPTSCHCLPLCSDLTYNAEITTSEWDFYNSDDTDNDDMMDVITDYGASAVRVFFKNNYFLPTQRDELYGTTDMISNIGGALGLITGFSLVSLAEIIYFLSVRLIENYRKYGYWAGPRNTGNEN